MAMTMHVDIVSAEQEIYSGTAEMVFAPLSTGEVGVLPRHAPLIARMKAGVVRVRVRDVPAVGDGQAHEVSGGCHLVSFAIGVAGVAGTSAEAR